MKVYCDTCVYIDALDLNPPRHQDPLRPLSDLAWSFLTKVNNGEYTLVISDWVKTEFKHVIGSDEKLNKLLDGINNKISVTKTREDEDKARELSKNNFADALHVILAKKAEAVILTTRDLPHFAEFQKLIEISLPESL